MRLWLIRRCISFEKSNPEKCSKNRSPPFLASTDIGCKLKFLFSARNLVGEWCPSSESTKSFSLNIAFGVMVGRVGDEEGDVENEL